MILRHLRYSFHKKLLPCSRPRSTVEAILNLQPPQLYHLSVMAKWLDLWFVSPHFSSMNSKKILKYALASQVRAYKVQEKVQWWRRYVFTPKNTKSPWKSRTFMLGCKIVAPLCLSCPKKNWSKTEDFIKKLTFHLMHNKRKQYRKNSGYIFYANSSKFRIHLWIFPLHIFGYLPSKQRTYKRKKKTYNGKKHKRI